MDVFLNASLIDYLDADDRPTFVLDSLAPVSIDINPIFHNNALLKNKSLLDSIKGRYTDTGSVISWTFTFRNFRKWVIEGGQTSWSTGTYLFKGYVWTRFAFNDRWIVLSGCSTDSGNDTEVPPTQRNEEKTPSSKSKHTRGSTDSISSVPSKKRISRDADHASTIPSLHKEESAEELSSPEPLASVLQSFDWTTTDVEQLSDYLKLVRSVDWPNTPLGPIESWSHDLRIVANLVMADPEPVVLFWGMENTMIYNELYIPIVDPKHPECLGTNVLTSLPQYNDYLVGIFDTIRRTFQTVTMPHIPIFLKNREGQLEEQYFSSRLYPLVGPAGDVIGIYERNTFITDEVQFRRR
jgi:hypothetical protein